MKLRIEIIGKGNLDIYTNTKIPVQIKNPIFHELGSHTLSFKVPSSSHNRKLFKFTNIPSRIKITQDVHKFRLFFSEKMIFDGTLRVLKSTTSDIHVYLQIGASSIIAMTKKHNINDLDDEYFQLDEARAYNAEYSNDKFKMGPFINQNVAYNKLVATTIGAFNHNYNAEPYSADEPVPMYKVSQIISYIAALLDYQIDIPIYKVFPELKDLVVVNLFKPVITHNKLEIWENTIPEYKASDFLKDFLNLFNLYISVNPFTQTVILQNKDVVLFDANIKESNNMHITEIKREEKVGHEFTMKADSSDTFSEELKYITLDGVRQIKTAMGVIDNVTNYPFDIVARVIFEDITDQPDATSTWYELKASVYTTVPKFDSSDSVGINPRILFHRGLQDSNNFIIQYIKDDNNTSFQLSDFQAQYYIDYVNGFAKYPFLTQTYKDANNATISGAELELVWEGEHGLLANFWQNSVDWEESNRLSASGIAYLSEQELSNFDIFSKYIIDNVKYIISEYSFNIEPDSISSTKFSAFKI